MNTIKRTGQDGTKTSRIQVGVYTYETGEPDKFEKLLADYEVPVRVSSGTQKGSLSALAGSKYLESIKPGKHGAAEALSQIRELPKHLQKTLWDLIAANPEKYSPELISSWILQNRIFSKLVKGIMAKRL